MTKNATCLIRDVTALMFKCGCNIWFTTQWQIPLPLPKIWSLRWSKSPPAKQVFRGCWILLWRISWDWHVAMKNRDVQLWVKRCKGVQSRLSGEQNQVEKTWKRCTGNKPVSSKENRKPENDKKRYKKGLLHVFRTAVKMLKKLTDFQYRFIFSEMFILFVQINISSQL